MEINQRVDELEGELKIIKNEVQSVLLDVREHVLSYYKNPFQMVNMQQPKGGGEAGITAGISSGSGGKDRMPNSGGSRGSGEQMGNGGGQTPNLGNGSDQAPNSGGGGTSGGQTPAFGSGSSGREQPAEERPYGTANKEQGGGARMEIGQEGTSQLKALMDQLERERQALKQKSQEPATPFTPLPGTMAQPATAAQSDPTAQFAQPAWGMQFIPGSPSVQQPGQPPQTSVRPPAMQPVQMPQATPGYQIAQGDSSYPDLSAGTDTADINDRPSYRPGNRPRKRSPEEREGTEEKEERGVGNKRRFGNGYKSEARDIEPRDSFEGEKGRWSEQRFGSSRSETKGIESHGKGDEPVEKDSAAQGKQVNLLTLVGLVRWVESSVKKIGKEKVEAIVEIYRTAGYLPESHNAVIAQIIRLAQGEKPEGPVPMGVSILVLLQLDSLLGGKFQTESSILSTLFTEDGGYPWTKQ